ncbi:MAG: site-specific integrase [Myxococcota bacterium]|nr:site-specific integrase [Myxococcota bacterium]
MTIRKAERDGTSRWVIDIPYKTADGKRERYRRDAQVQTKAATEAEHRRLLAELARTGTLLKVTAPADVAPTYTFDDAVRHFRATHAKSALKPSTRESYENRIDTLLVPRFGKLALEAIDGNAVAKLDVELVADELAASTRAKVQTVLRSILRASVRAGMLKAMPNLPALPKVGRKVSRPMRREDLEAILRCANAEGRLAFELAAFAALRASEVRGLRWSDVDLKVSTITVRRAITLGIEVTPKSHNQRVIPIGPRLRGTLEASAPKKASPWAPVAVTALGKPWGEFGLNQAFRRAMERAKLRGWSFHDLRHFFVTELFRNGASAAAIQQLAGHADLATTQRYADLDANDLRSAIERIDGKGVETARGDGSGKP